MTSRSNSPTNVAVTHVKPRCRFSHPLVLLVTCSVGLAVTVCAAWMLQARHIQRSGASASSAVERLHRGTSPLLCLNSLNRYEIGAANLCCATGLPGAEALDVERSLQTLDAWAGRVKAETIRHAPQFRQRPADFENSWGYFCMITLVTVLQQDLGVSPNPAAVGEWDFSDSSKVFIHGLLGDDRMGTCSSMPVLYVAIGRRLGYPLSLVPAKGHLFVRWEDGYPGGERFNIEATTRGIVCKTDDYYKWWPMPISDEELAVGYYLRSLTPQEELAEFLTMRGNCLEDLGQLGDAVDMYRQANGLAPSTLRHRSFLDSAVKRIARTGSGTPQHVNAAAPNRRRQPRPVMSDVQRMQMLEEMNARNQQLILGDPSPQPTMFP